MELLKASMEVLNGELRRVEHDDDMSEDALIDEVADVSGGSPLGSSRTPSERYQATSPRGRPGAVASININTRDRK
ncbi:MULTISPECIES: hypothetical protein [Sorangium]|nr:MULTISPECIES: hypothetical protein [Sorangium]